MHPDAIGQRIEVIADLDTVRIRRGLVLVGEHERCWARQQTITDAEHRKAADAMRQAYQNRTAAGGGPAATDVEQRDRASDDQIFGVDGDDEGGGGGADGDQDQHRPPRPRAGRGRRGSRRCSRSLLLTRALKAPTLRATASSGWPTGPASRAGRTSSSWPPACNARCPPVTPTAGRADVGAARFPARKSLEEFDFDHQRPSKARPSLDLGTLDFITSKDNAIFLGPPGTGKTMLAIGLGIRACQAGHRVAFATAAEWVARLATAHHAGRLQAEITKLGRTPLLIIDEVGEHPVPARSGEPVLSARLRPRRTGEPHRHQQQTLRPLGRGLRRRCGRRRDDRPARPITPRSSR